MIYFGALPRSSAHIDPNMTYAPLSESEIITHRLAAAKRVRRKRLLLRLGLAIVRQNWRRITHSPAPRRIQTLNQPAKQHE